MAAISDYLENELLDHALGTGALTAPSGVYLSLHTADPTDAGTGAEVSGGSYARQLCAFGASSSGTASNSAVEEFTVMPAATVTHIGIWDAVSTGNLLFHGALTASKTVGAGDTVRIDAAGVSVTLA